MTGHTYIHAHSILMAIFPGEPGLAGYPLNFPSPFIPKQCILFGTGLNYPRHSQHNLIMSSLGILSV